jgi:hypothetical protein
MHRAGVMPYFLLMLQTAAQKEKFFACENLACFDMFDTFCGIGFLMMILKKLEGMK